MKENLTIEEIFERLEKVTTQLESGDLSLEESFSYYQKGMELIKTCNDKIDKIEKQIIVLDENEEEHEL